MPSMSSIPDLSSPRSQIGIYNFYDETNSEFYRELADYEYKRRLCQPVRLVVENTGKVAAKNVRVEMTVSNQSEITALKKSDFPSLPSRDRLTKLASLRWSPYIHRDPGDVRIENISEMLIIKADFGDLQPGRRVCSETFYIGSRISQEIVLSVFVYADNLTIPKEFTLKISVSSKITSMTFEQLKLMG
jgi:hypothetical protein